MLVAACLGIECALMCMTGASREAQSMNGDGKPSWGVMQAPARVLPHTPDCELVGSVETGERSTYAQGYAARFSELTNMLRHRYVVRVRQTKALDILVRKPRDRSIIAWAKYLPRQVIVCG